MSGPPRVSVALPFRDAAATLAEAAESIRGQTLREFECLLVDNRSSDGSRSIALSICSGDPRFRLLDVGGGLVDALNAGIEAARAPVIARMDADDIAHPRRLERQLELLRRDRSLSIASCLVSCFPKSTVRDGIRRYVAWLNSRRSPDQIRDALFVESPLPHPSVVVTRRALLAVGGYRDDAGPEDYDLWMRLLLRGHRAAKVPETLLHWRDSPGRLSRAHPRYGRRRFFETKLRYLPAVLACGTPLQIWGAGPIGRRWGRELRRLGYAIRRYIDVDPRKIGRHTRGAPIEAPSCADPSAGFSLAAVGAPGAREQIEAALGERGLQPWRDYLAVA